MQVLLIEVTNENDVVQERLDKIEKENEDLKELMKKEAEKEESKSLSEELGISDPRSLHSSFECDPCGNEVRSKESVSTHRETKHEGSLEKIFKWKLLDIELEKRICIQKLQISSDVIKLKEMEMSKAEKCNSRGFCRIFHTTHNWSRPQSRMFADQLRSLN